MGHNGLQIEWVILLYDEILLILNNLLTTPKL